MKQLFWKVKVRLSNYWKRIKSCSCFKGIICLSAKKGILDVNNTKTRMVPLLHCLKSVGIRSCSGPYFPAFGLNTNQNNSEYGHFLRSVGHCINGKKERVPWPEIYQAYSFTLNCWLCYHWVNLKNVLVSSSLNLILWCPVSTKWSKARCYRVKNTFLIC